MASGILFVCYANMCRSPMAEYILRDMLARQPDARRPPIPVSSAGTNAIPGYRMHPHAAAVTAGLGADPGPFRSRPLTVDIIARAGLVLAATHRERALCVSLVPTAMHRTFTLRQFSRLAAAAATDGGATHGDATPGGNTPGGNTPGGNTPGGNTPGGNTLGGDTVGGNAAATPVPDSDAGRDPARRLATAVAAAARARGRLQPVEPGDEDLADPVGQPIAAFHQCAGQIEAALAPVVALIASC